MDWDDESQVHRRLIASKNPHAKATSRMYIVIHPTVIAIILQVFTNHLSAVNSHFCINVIIEQIVNAMIPPIAIHFVVSVLYNNCPTMPIIREQYDKQLMIKMGLKFFCFCIAFCFSDSAIIIMNNMLLSILFFQ